MHYCYHHPDTAASHYCPSCQEYRCDTCSNEVTAFESRCFKCGHELTSIGTGYAADPFWRRLDAMFRYAFNAEVMIFIGVISVLISVLSMVPSLFAFIFILILTGTFIKYCFVCLQSTALGNMQPPSITESYQEGLTALFRLILVFVLIGGMSALSFAILGLNLGALFSVLLLAGLPAAIINLAMTDSVLAAVNPVRIFSLMMSIGFAYGILLAFILIMSSSVVILQAIIGDNLSLVGVILQSFVSYFYGVVMFHMMGYMIFQYQHKLGFVARDDDYQRKIRSDLAKQQAHINMLLREGDFVAVNQQYDNNIKTSPNNLSLLSQYVDFLLKTKQGEQLSSVADKYLTALQYQQRAEQMPLLFKRVRQVISDYKPATPELRMAVAEQLSNLGEHQLALGLLNGLHKDFAHHDKVPQAYQLGAKIFAKMGQTDNAKKLLMLAKQLAQQQSQQSQQPQQATASNANSPKKLTQAKSHQHPNHHGGHAQGGLGGLSLVIDD